MEEAAEDRFAALEEKLSRAEEALTRVIDRVGRTEDREQIERLQYQYGFFLDNRMWDEVADLFTDDDPYIEIGQRGRYRGKERIRTFLTQVLGGGRWGLHAGEVINHLQLQPVVTLADDRGTARMRSRAVVQGGIPGGATFLTAEGVYEGEFVREPAGWRIKGVWWVPTFYVEVQGWARAAFDSAPQNEEFPPDDGPSIDPEVGLGRRFIPFHYPHPVTGEQLPAPSSLPVPTIADGDRS